MAPCTSCRSGRWGSSWGHGLPEALAVSALAVLLAAQGIPALTHQWRLWRLESASLHVADILRAAREQSSGRGQALRLELDPGSGDSGSACLLLHDGAAGACTGCSGEPLCRGGAVALARTSPLPPGIMLRSSSASLLWHPAAGTVTPTATLRVSLADGRTEAQHVVNLLGRVRSCAQGEPLRGHEAC